MNNIDYFFNRLIRFTILFFILYLIFTNFGTFLIVITVIVILGYFFVYKKIKQFREQQSTFRAHFNAKDFRSGQDFAGFKFEDFQNFNSNFENVPRYDEIRKAKEFFGFTTTPSKEELKKRYKELARKYHPDINSQDDTKMKELNHYRDVLMKIAL